MQRIVSTAKVVATSSMIKTLAKMSARAARRVLGAQAAFIDALERFATKY